MTAAEVQAGLDGMEESRQEDEKGGHLPSVSLARTWLHVYSNVVT